MWRCFFEAFVAIKKIHSDLTKKEIHLHFRETSCRRSKCRGTAGAGNIGWCFIVMRGFTLQRFKKQPRSSKFHGTTHSCAYTDLTWPSARSLPMMKSADKKNVYSWNASFVVNDVTLNAADDAKMAKKAGSFKGLLPPVWFSRDIHFLSELLANFRISSVVSLAAGDGALANAGLLLTNPIVSINVCWTDVHRKLLNTVLDDRIVKLIASKDQTHFFVEGWETEIASLFPHLFADEQDEGSRPETAASDSDDVDDGGDML